MPTSRLIWFNENKCFLQFYLGLEHKQDKALNINKIWQLAAKVFPSSMFRPRSDSFNSEMICRKRHFHYVSNIDHIFYSLLVFSLRWSISIHAFLSFRIMTIDSMFFLWQQIELWKLNIVFSSLLLAFRKGFGKWDLLWMFKVLILLSPFKGVR